MLHNSDSLTVTADCARRLLLDLAGVCMEAGRAIEAIRASDLGLEYKKDNSPLTRADIAAEGILNQFLQRYAIPIVSEEASPERLNAMSIGGQAYWLVDPLDGTREFVAGRPHYTVNLALIHENFPLLGLVYAPAMKALYLGFTLGDPREEGEACQRRAWKFSGQAPKITDLIDRPGTPNQHTIRSRHGNANSLHALVSASHLDARTASWVNEHPVTERSDFGSSLKFCKLAEGFSDVYPRFAPTMEWDTAAGQAVLEAAGGLVVDEQMDRFRYSKSGWRNSPFIAWANPLLSSECLIQHDSASNSNIQTSNLTKHRQMHELIAGLANKTS